MAGFRDDREALLARLDALEAELARAGGQQERAALGKRVEELAAAVRATTDRVDRDRGALAELGTRLDALRRDLAGPDAPAPAPASERAPAPAMPSLPVAGPTAGGFRVWMIVLPLALAAVFLWITGSRDDPGGPPTPTPPRDDRFDPPGGLHAFDPIAGLELARERSPLGAGGRLSHVTARYVSPNGTVDLDAPAYQGSVEYEFFEPGTAPPSDPQAPLGVPRPTTMGQVATVRVTATGVDPGEALPFPIGASLPEPRCTLARLWSIASSRGAPRQAVATIEYGGSAEQANWSFSIADTGINFSLTDAECASHPGE